VWGGWRDQEIAVDPAVIGADVSALAFSPSYAREHTLVVVASTGSDVATYPNSTRLCLGERNKGAGTTDWAAFTGYPLEIIDAGDAVDPSLEIRSSLALPSDFFSGNAGFRKLFVSVDRNPDHNDDVYRIIADQLDPPGDDGRMYVDGGDIDVWSIAYRGTRTSGVLLAGERNPMGSLFNVQVHRCESPWAPSPAWEPSEVPPTGPGYATVVWAPNVSLAYCGSSSRPGQQYDESAFSASSNGNLWRQMALIDTALTLTDLAVTPDGRKLFLTTSNESGPESVWHSFSEPLGLRWERLLTVDSATDAVLVKLSANYVDDGTLYVAAHGSDLLAVSHNRGNAWVWRTRTPEPLLDMLVVDDETVYAAIPGGMVMVSTYGGRHWEDPVDTTLGDINMLARATDGTLFAGSGDGYVAWSKDGETWIVLDEPVGGGPVQVRPDPAFASNGWVYASTDDADSGLRRWRIGESVYWEQLDSEVTDLGDGQIVGGLLCGDEGTLYALRIEPSGVRTGGMTRWLCPACVPCAEHEFDHVIEDLPAGASFVCADAYITSYPVGTLWGDEALNDVFAIDSAGQRIFRYRDTLCKRGPWLDAPVDGAALDDNACDCNRDAVVTFDWEDMDEVEEYQVSLYHEASVAARLWDAYSDYDGLVISPSGDTSEFQSGTTYGWRVRTVSPLLSPWSDMWRLYPRLLQVTELQPAPGETGVSLQPIFTWNGPGMAAAYEFTLARDPEFTRVIASFAGDAALDVTAWVCDRELSPGTSYFWRVRSVNGDACSPWVAGAFTTVGAASAPVTGGATTIDLSAQEPLTTDVLIWVMLGVLSLLMVALIVLVLRTARR
ncbi:MAG: PQQ-like beta-propeller repeat protein, partial [Dehalococcoidia bacterium]|nr:PQQ-like beta-propeller repeat protein [Dehalococcoidia bacterium]